jgi:hypothetical protein
MSESDRQKVLSLIGKSQSKSRFTSSLSDISERTEESKLIDNFDNLTSISRNSSSRNKPSSRPPSETSHNGKVPASTHKSSSSRSNNSYVKSEACYSKADSINSSQRTPSVRPNRPSVRPSERSYEYTPPSSPRKEIPVKNTQDFDEDYSYLPYLNNGRTKLEAGLEAIINNPAMLKAAMKDNLNPEIRKSNGISMKEMITNYIAKTRTSENCFDGRSGSGYVHCSGVEEIDFNRYSTGSVHLRAKFQK